MIGLISDVHGNYAALSSVLAALDGMRVRRIICLGDVAGYYCHINECCDELRARGIPTLLGNHDYYLTRNVPCPRSASANRCLEHQRKIIRQDNMDWLAGQESRAFWHGIHIAHGGFRDPLDEYLIPTEAYFSSYEGPLFASGHTHVQLLWEGNVKKYCNPGSVGQPRDGNPAAAFAIWDGNRFIPHRVSYDVALVRQAMAAAGFTPYFTDNLEIGAMIGGKVLSPSASL